MNLDDSVQALADRIGRPLLVFDDKFNVVAFSVHDGEVDRARLSIILSHRGSAKAAAAIAEHRVGHAKGPVRIPEIDGSPPRVVTALRHDGRLTGYVSYVPTDAVTEPVDGAHLREARDEVGAILAALAVDQRTDADRVHRLLAALVGGRQSRRDAAAVELADSGLLGPAVQYQIMVFRSVGDAERIGLRGRLLLEAALSEMPSASSSGTVGSVVDGKGILLAPFEVPTARVQRVLEGSRFATIVGGGGAPRDQLVDVHESFREARLALRAARCDPARYGRVAMWADLGLDRLLMQLPLEGLTLDDLPDAIQRLLVASSGPDLAETLEVYLDNGADAQCTAAKLHVHRSTLYYRLDRVRALIGADLSDGTVRRELHTALRVATLARLR